MDGEKKEERVEVVPQVQKKPSKASLHRSHFTSILYYYYQAKFHFYPRMLSNFLPPFLQFKIF
jgi:hypothetical protein